jgi:hypothetical protein
VLFAKYHSNDEANENEVGRACSPIVSVLCSVFLFMSANQLSGALEKLSLMQYPELDEFNPYCYTPFLVTLLSSLCLDLQSCICVDVLYDAI